MIFDGILTILSLIAILRGWQKGLIWGIFSFVAVVIALIASFYFSPLLTKSVSQYFTISNQGLLLIAFLVISFLIFIFLRFLIRLFESLLEKLMLGWINRLCGAGLYLFGVLLFFSTLIWIGNQLALIKRTQTTTSKLFPIIEPIAPVAYKYTIKLLPYGRELVQNFQEFLHSHNPSEAYHAH